MKKLTKDERKGAIALAIVVVLILGVSLLFRNCKSGKSDESPKIEVIYQENGSESSDSDDRDYSHYKTGGKQGKKSGKKGKGNSRSGRSASRGEKAGRTSVKTIDPPRDFLSDTIPTLYDDYDNEEDF